MFTSFTKLTYFTFYLDLDGDDTDGDNPLGVTGVFADRDKNSSISLPNGSVIRAVADLNVRGSPTPLSDVPKPRSSLKTNSSVTGRTKLTATVVSAADGSGLPVHIFPVSESYVSRNKYTSGQTFFDELDGKYSHVEKLDDTDDDYNEATINNGQPDESLLTGRVRSTGTSTKTNPASGTATVGSKQKQHTQARQSAVDACNLAGAEMYRVMKRNSNVVSRMEALASQAEANYWMQRRLNDNCQLEARGFDVPVLPVDHSADDFDLLSASVKTLIPSDGDENDRKSQFFVIILWGIFRRKIFCY